MVSGGSMRSTLPSAGSASTLFSRSAPRSSMLGIDALQPQHQAAAAHAGVDALVAGERGQPLGEQRAVLLYGVEEAIAQHHVEHGVATAHASGLPPKVVPWLPGTMAAATSSRARQAPMGKPFPSALATAMISGVTPGPFVGEEPPGAPDAALHLVEDEQRGRHRYRPRASPAGIHRSPDRPRPRLAPARP